MPIEQVLKSDIEEIVARLGDAAQRLSGKTVLLTGANGFLGRSFSELFSLLNVTVLEKPVTLIGLDKSISSPGGNESPVDRPHIRLIKHDVVQPFTWEEPLDFIIHAAGIPSPIYYRAYPLETLHISITGTQNMLELAQRHHARFVFFSSSEIYGDPSPEYVPTPESYRGNVACQGPRACYDESKRVGETLCHIFHEIHGTATNTIRPFNVYGPGMSEKDYRVLPNFANCIKGGHPLKVYGNGRQTRTYCYLTDALLGFLLVVLRGVPGEPYNIGADSPEISVIELVDQIEKVLGRKLPRHIIDHPDSYPADEPQRRCPNIRKARLQLNYEPRVELDDGLQRFLTWSDRAYTGHI